MSADRWSECAVCKHDTKEKLEKFKQDVQLHYGLVSIQDFIKLTNELSEKEQDFIDNFPTTLREDWAITIEDNILTIEYYASCKVCGFNYKYNKVIDMLEHNNRE